MLVFCEFEQQFSLIELAKRYGLNRYINLVFRKNFSAQVLKANMKIVGNCEYGLIFYREKLPKFRNNGKMIFNCIDWPRDNENEKIGNARILSNILTTSRLDYLPVFGAGAAVFGAG